MEDLRAPFLAFHAVESRWAGFRTVGASPTGWADAVTGIGVAGGVIQASANFITIFTIVTAPTVGLAMNALGCSIVGYQTRPTKTRNTKVQKQKSELN